MKKLVSLIAISVCFLFYGCGSTPSKTLSLDKRLEQNYETDKLLGNCPEEGIEVSGSFLTKAGCLTLMADRYNTRAQLLTAIPERKSEAGVWIQKSMEICESVISNYANDPQAQNIYAVMANNMFLLGNQAEVEQYCFRFRQAFIESVNKNSAGVMIGDSSPEVQNLPCPILIEELK